MSIADLPGSFGFTINEIFFGSSTTPLSVCDGAGLGGNNWIGAITAEPAVGLLRRFGNVVSFSSNLVSRNLNVSSLIALQNPIPEEYRPSSDVTFPIVVINGVAPDVFVYGSVTILANGGVLIAAGPEISKVFNSTDCGFLFFCVSYLIV